VGIEAPKAFVFVLSPDSIVSQIGKEELDQAVALKKRIVPIRVRPVDAAAVSPALAAPNWISFAKPILTSCRRDRRCMDTTRRRRQTGP
jgi:TIR domain